MMVMSGMAMVLFGRTGLILMSGEPQGAIKMRRHDPDLYGRYDRQYGRSPAYAADSDDVGHLLRFNVGRRSDLMSATISNVPEGRNG